VVEVVAIVQRQPQAMVDLEVAGMVLAEVAQAILAAEEEGQLE
jgi:hypothetical protein